MPWVTKKIQINIPFRMLIDSYIEYFINHRLNPEIGFDAATLEHYSLADFRNIAEQLSQNSLTVTFHGPFIDLSPGSPDPAVRALTGHRFEQILKLIPLFNPKTVVCHTGYDRKRYGYFKDQWLENSMKIWSWFGSRVRDEGSRLILENVYEHQPDDIRPLLEGLSDQNVGFCLDIGHQTVFSHASAEIWLKSLAPFLGQLHLHDNLKKYDDHIALGQGEINFHHFFDLLKHIEKKPSIITLEIHRQEDLWPSIDFLEKMWPW
ncbi:MAG: sugar phosphate isomerase/epimerase [Desulfobacterales bacterium]|nr:sugar phosphate isomerase/epimerase [Desulfobacterales bacterium]